MDHKVFSDSIHGSMSFHPLLVVVMDTPQVQRLRNIKQLGPCYFVFPSASHNRFEHSLGTAFIAGKLFDSVKQKRIPSGMNDSTWEEMKLCAQLAGLCHDLGHGPFSHLWERFKYRCGTKWAHEPESVNIFEEILKEEISPSKKFTGLKTVEDVFSHYGLRRYHIDIIKRMILGEKSKKNYLYQVISNKNNNIDVDKWEYIVRDSFMLNVPIGFDFHRLLNYCCVLSNSQGEEQICYRPSQLGFPPHFAEFEEAGWNPTDPIKRDKESSAVLEMFLARGKLHDVAYQHAKVKIIEAMLLDAFMLANERLKLSETPITNLTDHIYQKILYDDFGNDRNMMKAKEILKRIENRYLYKCIAQENFQGEKPKFNRIKESLKSIIELQPFIEDITATFIEVHMTKANRKKTLEKLLVYGKLNGDCYYTFDWDQHQNSLKLDLKNLERNQILLLYKGKLLFPDSLKKKVSDHLKEILTNESSD